jgi:hypothetical protein
MVKKENISKFFVTINSNQTHPKYITLLKTSYNKFYDNLESFIKFLNQNEGIDKIHSMNLEACVECGKINKRFHIHSFITIQHYTKLRLDQEKIRNFFCEELNLPSIHINIKYVPDNTIGIRNYMKKGYL